MLTESCQLKHFVVWIDVLALRRTSDFPPASSRMSASTSMHDPNHDLVL